MNEQFDNLFADKVRDSFNELEVGFSESNWQQFLVKEKKAANVIPLFYKKALSYAAVFLVIIGVIFSFNLILSESQNSTSTPEQNQVVENTEGNQNAAPGITENNQEKELENIDESIPKESSDAETNGLIAADENDSGTGKNRVNEEDENPVTASIGYAAVEQVGINSGKQKSVFDTEINDAKFLVASKEQEPEPVFYIPEEPENRINTLELHASSLTNYSEADPSSALNYSGGISSEIRLANRIGFSSGFTVAKQSLEIDNSGVDITSESELGETSTSTFADLVTLDVPLNIRYYFKENRESYFSFGVSSFVYLRENFITSFRQVREETIERDGVETVFRSVEEINNQRSEEAFSRFDFAKTVNVSFGFEYSLSHKLGIIFEPYAKIPIAPLTSEQVRFGSGGLHVRFQLKN